MDALLQSIRTMLKRDRAPDLLIRSFCSQVKRVRDGQSASIPVAALEPLDHITALADLHAAEAAGRRALPHTLLIKLNGGLGTSMGLDRAKSLLPVKDGLTFLDLICRQVLHLRREHHATLPLLFMNSFSTADDTAAVLHRYPELARGQDGIPPGFLQNRVPRLRADTLVPAQWPGQPAKTWCPPGHGDLYVALATSGLLDQLLHRGFRYAFISNADNLGAVLNLSLLGHLADQNLPFIMEVTRRTPADRKGGHLAKAIGGPLLLREIAQCPQDELDDFQNIQRHRYFNTNNLWLDLAALQDILHRTREPPPLPVICNLKKLDPQGPEILQLETAMGAAIQAFPGAQAIDVPRTRFSPVKTTDDLLGLMSDAFTLTPDHRIVLNPQRPDLTPPPPRFHPRHLKTIYAF
ncbi:MAG TPA: UTP--glucose-1-phosphate uridylyltransferase [Kiritimatiellia bacterium]|nr:UTP--glucose-1-phosphate uridylyltransferase [Kiritimatiellia bacterium]